MCRPCESLAKIWHHKVVNKQLTESPQNEQKLKTKTKTKIVARFCTRCYRELYICELGCEVVSEIRRTS